MFFPKWVTAQVYLPLQRHRQSAHFTFFSPARLQEPWAPLLQKFSYNVSGGEKDPNFERRVSLICTLFRMFRGRVRGVGLDHALHHPFGAAGDVTDPTAMGSRASAGEFLPNQ